MVADLGSSECKREICKIFGLRKKASPYVSSTTLLRLPLPPTIPPSSENNRAEAEKKPHSTIPRSVSFKPRNPRFQRVQQQRTWQQSWGGSMPIRSNRDRCFSAGEWNSSVDGLYYDSCRIHANEKQGAKHHPQDRSYEKETEFDEDGRPPPNFSVNSEGERILYSTPSSDKEGRHSRSKKDRISFTLNCKNQFEHTSYERTPSPYATDEPVQQLLGILPIPDNRERMTKPTPILKFGEPRDVMRRERWRG
ncbi:hypothetical protein LTR95_008861 [Oleoguttula sp. CCFEE 5521]